MFLTTFGQLAFFDHPDLQQQATQRQQYSTAAVDAAQLWQCHSAAEITGKPIYTYIHILIMQAGSKSMGTNQPLCRDQQTAHHKAGRPAASEAGQIAPWDDRGAAGVIIHQQYIYNAGK